MEQDFIELAPCVIYNLYKVYGISRNILFVVQV